MSRIPLSKTERAVQLIRERGTMRSDEIEQALGIDNAASLLATRVMAGDLVSCKVTVAGKRHPLNEYRISAAAGMPRIGTSPWRGDPADKKPPLRLPVEATFGTPSPSGTEPAAISGPSLPPVRSRFVGEIENHVPMPQHSRVLNPELLARMTALKHKPVGASFVTGFGPKHCYGVAKKVGVKVMCGKDSEGTRVWRRE